MVGSPDGRKRGEGLCDLAGSSLGLQGLGFRVEGLGVEGLI